MQLRLLQQGRRRWWDSRPEQYHYLSRLACAQLRSRPAQPATTHNHFRHFVGRRRASHTFTLSSGLRVLCHRLCHRRILSSLHRRLPVRLSVRRMLPAGRCTPESCGGLEACHLPALAIVGLEALRICGCSRLHRHWQRCQVRL